MLLFIERFYNISQITPTKMYRLLSNVFFLSTAARKLLCCSVTVLGYYRGIRYGIRTDTTGIRWRTAIVRFVLFISISVRLIFFFLFFLNRIDSVVLLPFGLFCTTVASIALCMTRLTRRISNTKYFAHEIKPNMKIQPVDLLIIYSRFL